MNARSAAANEGSNQGSKAYHRPLSRNTAPDPQFAKTESASRVREGDKEC
jgi:hypothetical protein